MNRERSKSGRLAGEPAEKGAKDVVAEGIAKAHRIPGEEEVPRDLVEARKTITKMVRESATEIVSKLIEVAKTGQVAQAKYLFEAVGLYPPTEETTTANPEDSLAYITVKVAWLAGGTCDFRVGRTVSECRRRLYENGGEPIIGIGRRCGRS